MMSGWIHGWKITFGIWLVVEGTIACFANSTLAQELKPLADNTVVLTARSPSVTSYSPWLTPILCSAGASK